MSANDAPHHDRRKSLGRYVKRMSSVFKRDKLSTTTNTHPDPDLVADPTSQHAPRPESTHAHDKKQNAPANVVAEHVSQPPTPEAAPEAAPAAATTAVPQPATPQAALQDDTAQSRPHGAELARNEATPTA